MQIFCLDKSLQLEKSGSYFDLVFILAVPIMWFLTAVCFVAQISTDYMHKHEPTQKSTKKSVYTANGNLSG